VHVLLQLAVNALLLESSQFRVVIVNLLVDPHRNRHGSQLKSETVTELSRQLQNSRGGNLMFPPVIVRHQCRNVIGHVVFGDQIELGSGVSKDGPKGELTLESDQIREHSLLLWLVKKDVCWLLIGCDLDSGVPSELGVALQQNRLATCGFNTVEKWLLQRLRFQRKYSEIVSVRSNRHFTAIDVYPVA